MLKAIEWKQHKLFVVDLNKLPQKAVKLQCRNPQQIAEAITTMKVQGASALGIAAAFGVYLAVKTPPLAKTYDQLQAQIEQAVVLLNQTRPAAASLFWALERMKNCARNNRDHKLPTLRDILLREAISILKEDEKAHKIISGLGAEMLRDSDQVLTYGNVGALSAAGPGGPLGVITESLAGQKKIRVLVCETRPRLQGARLAALELKQARVNFHLITDNMAAYFMQKGQIDVVIVGADRIVLNGDAVGTMGSYGLAMLAYYHNLPFYITAPVCVFERKSFNQDFVPLTERSPEEVTGLNGKSISLPKVKAYNPAFDIIPHKYISAIITELGVIRAPYDQNLRDLFFSLE
ncbi:S-methyl-5-thioribose-1-phosphate isomerase [bacterium]|nr:S-methyl-5-thioribose-1-phosphate isomerase [bacterium]